jgi:hypothetical protein
MLGADFAFVPVVFIDGQELVDAALQRDFTGIDGYPVWISAELDIVDL